MDCMTISTYRNLEQLAIRQYKDIKSRETNRQINIETFRQENSEVAKSAYLKKNTAVDSTICNKILNYFA